MKSLNELRAIKNKMMCQVNLRLGSEATISSEAEGAQVHKNYILVNLCDAFDPAVQRSIGMVLDAAHRAGIEAGMCGELAADPPPRT